MKAKRFFLIFALIAVLLTAYSNCGKGLFSGSTVNGTEIGNPFSGGPNAAQGVASYQVLVSLCNVLVRCNPQMSVNQCQNGVFTAPNIIPALGLSGATYSSIASVQNAELAGTVVANPTELSSCMDTVNGLPCSAAVAAGTFSANAQNFSDVYKIIPTSGACPHVYFSSQVNL